MQVLHSAGGLAESVTGIGLVFGLDDSSNADVNEKRILVSQFPF